MRKIAILIRDLDQFNDGFPMIDHLNRAGVRVQVFLIGQALPAVIQKHPEWQEFLNKPGIIFYSSSSGGMKNSEFHTASKTKIAQLISRADMVIPL